VMSAARTLVLIGELLSLIAFAKVLVAVRPSRTNVRESSSIAAASAAETAWLKAGYRSQRRRVSRETPVSRAAEATSPVASRASIALRWRLVNGESPATRPRGWKVTRLGRQLHREASSA
jgi:hypothetical protein